MPQVTQKGCPGAPDSLFYDLQPAYFRVPVAALLAALW